MEVTFFQKNLNKNEESAFVEYVNKKLPSIEHLLSAFAKDESVLRVSIEKFNKHDAFEVELCLVLPIKSLIATEASHSISKAVDLSKDRLISQIKKHLTVLRKNRSHRSIRGDRVAKVEQLTEVTGETF